MEKYTMKNRYHTVFFTLIESIATEMRMICFFGLAGNLLGALCFLLARKRGGKNDE